jgi:ferredoxin-NADP reductase
LGLAQQGGREAFLMTQFEYLVRRGFVVDVEDDLAAGLSLPDSPIIATYDKHFDCTLIYLQQRVRNGTEVHYCGRAETMQALGGVVDEAIASARSIHIACFDALRDGSRVASLER